RPWRRQGRRGEVEDYQPGLRDPQSQLLQLSAGSPATFFHTRKHQRMATVQEAALTPTPAGNPDIKISVRQTFGIDSDLEVPAFSKPSEHVPDIDDAYRFDHDTTLAILAGFAFNRRVMICGYHGTGKSTHVEQVAARLNWPCIRVNL